MLPSATFARLRDHWPLLPIVLLVGCLLFIGLGQDYLWEDEGDTAVLARNIQTHGVPVAWDGVTLSDADYGQRLNSQLVMVSHPWLQYYLAAAAFTVFGESAWAARAPFALAGLLTIVAVYVLALRVTRRRDVATVAVLLLAASVQFLLYARQARNYSVHALLTCVLVWQFQRLDSWKRSAGFAVTAILLFHTHAIGLAVPAAMGLLVVTVPTLRSRGRWFWPAAVVTAIYALPWLLISRRGQAESLEGVRTVGSFALRITQFAGELGSVTPVIGVLILAGAAVTVNMLARRRRHPERQIPMLTSEERVFVLTVAAIVVAEAAVVAATHTSADIWILGLHHTPALIPLTIIVAAILIAKCGNRRPVFLGLVLIFAFTRLPHLAPWALWSPSTVKAVADDSVQLHIPARLIDRMLRTTQLEFVRGLRQPNPGVIAGISTYLREHASPGDLVITNYEWEALYFHTDLPQAARISYRFPIYRTARALQLPDYVFGAERVRWIVWRRAWPAFFAEQDCERLLQGLAEAGVTVTRVASIPDTLYENRENVNFRRYPGNRYIFPWYPPLPDTEIYRVDRDSPLQADFNRAGAQLERGEFELAIGGYESYLRQRPDDVQALTQLAIAQVASGRTDAALFTFRHVARIAPDQAGVRRNAATALFDAGLVEEAYTHARAAVELQPDDADAIDLLHRISGRLRPAAPPDR